MPFPRLPHPGAWVLLASLLLSLPAGVRPAAAETLPPITIDNRSYPTRCAEEDNVFVLLVAPTLSRFRVEARHPSYIASILRDQYAPDFTHCDFGPEPPATGPVFTPRQFVLWENDTHMLVANTDRHFWRAVDVPVSVGERTEHHLHLLQFYAKRGDGRRDQVLVLYPSDGHWRLKPLPVPHLDYNVYGASLLLGPVEAEDRRKPFAAYGAVRFDPARLTFTVTFARGGGAEVRIAAATRESTAIEVVLQGEGTRDRAFAALRSMYVTTDNADVAALRVEPAEGAPWSVPVLQAGAGPTPPARALAFVRTAPSRHNTSAPDTVFRAPDAP